MELLSVHIKQKENSYFIFLFKMFAPIIKKSNSYNDKNFFYTKVVLIKHFTFGLRLKSLGYLKTLVNVSWFSKLIRSFLVIRIDSIYLPIKWDTCESIEDAEDRLGVTFDGEKMI